MMRFYGFFRSSSAYRCRIAFNLKGVQPDVTTVSLRDRSHKTPEYLAMNPQGLVPVLDTGTARLAQSLAGSGALFIDLKGEFESLYATYMREAVRLSLFGVLAIAVLLAVSLRSVTRLVRVLFTLALAVGTVMLAFHLAGVKLHLLHLVGLLLIVAVGSNYALFLDRAEGGEPLDAGTLLSMSVATLTTVIGFGTLASSSVPVLQAVGATVAPGALLALLMAAVLVYPKAVRR